MIRIGSILIPSCDEAPYKFPRRVLTADAGGYWLIPVDFDGRRKYAHGPHFVDATYLHSAVSDGRLRIGDFKCPVLWQAQDEDLNRWFGGSTKAPCKIIQVRERAYTAIQPYISNTSIHEALTTKSYTNWIRETSKATGHSQAYLYDALHRLWAGDEKNALLGLTCYNGGRGKPKKQTRKLGRPNALDAVAGRASSGLALSDEDKIKLQCGWQCFVSDGRSVRQAHLETARTFYAVTPETGNGNEETVLADADKRPTLRQFRYWGPRGDPAQSATRRMLGEHEYRLNHLGMHGSATDGIRAVGQRGWIDSSGGDVRLSSITHRATEVGIATYLDVMEALTQVICGVYIGFEPPSARVFLLAAAHAALSKEAWCARFGISGVTDDMIPSLRFEELFHDNGEGRNAQTMRVYLKAWEGWIEFAPAGDGRAKGTIEGDHHLRHLDVDHRLPGTTHPPPGTKPTPAIVNYYEYVGHHIHRIIYHNAIEVAPAHLITGEMRNELDATATRMDVFRWYVRHGYVTSPPPDPEMIRAHMLPSFPATITERGIFLHRPDRGNKKEYVQRCRYVNEYLVESGLLEAARRKVIPAEISLDPNDLSVAWFRTRDEGLLQLRNVYPDEWLIRHCTLDELLMLQDRDHLTLLANTSGAEQKAVDFMDRQAASVSSSINARTNETELTRPTHQGAGTGGADVKQKETDLLEQRGLADPTGKRTGTRCSPSTAVEPDHGGFPAQPSIPNDPVPAQDDETFDDVLDAIRHFEDEENPK